MRISDWSSDVCSSDLLNFAVSTAVLATMLAAAPAYAQDPAEPAATEAGDDGIIVVTARKRDETLSDVPIAVTAIDGDTLAARGGNSSREAAERKSDAQGKSGQVRYDLEGVGAI